jgi:hypothetical protein
MSTEVASELEQRVAALINAERAAEGLAPLRIEAHLNASAQGHSEWMGRTGTFSHAGEDGSSATDRIEAAGFPLTGSWQTAENIASTSLVGGLGTGEVDGMHEKLMESAGHRANMLDPDAAYLGIGLSVGTIDFGGVGVESAILTEHFANTDGEVLVQEEQGGETVFQPYQDGEPVGEPQIPPDDPGTETPPDPDEDDEDPQGLETASAGGCFVATAVYGDPTHPDVRDLRRFRDQILVRHAAGRAFIRAYRVVGPRLATLLSADGASGRVARALIAPLARLARARLARPGPTEGP